MLHLPPLIAGSCLLVYWGTVLIKAARIGRGGRHANLVPRERTGRWLRIIWVPVIISWCIQPWLSLGRQRPHVPMGALELAWLGAGICICATAATFFCWRAMGRSWRIGINPAEKTQLVRSGPFRSVRHPIYSLSIMLALGSLATTPTGLMLVLVTLHIALLIFEAHREEAHLLRQHGEQYASYCAETGRFFPRVRTGK